MLNAKQTQNDANTLFVGSIISVTVKFKKVLYKSMRIENYSCYICVLRRDIQHKLMYRSHLAIGAIRTHKATASNSLGVDSIAPMIIGQSNYGSVHWCLFNLEKFENAKLITKSRQRARTDSAMTKRGQRDKHFPQNNTQNTTNLTKY